MKASLKKLKGKPYQYPEMSDYVTEADEQEVEGVDLSLLTQRKIKAAKRVKKIKRLGAAKLSLHWHHVVFF